MSKAKVIHSEQNLADEYNQLTAFKRNADSNDGKMFIDFVLKECHLDYDAFDISKNSGNTANTLGKQGVGRAIIDKLIEAGVKIDCTVFSKKKKCKIESLEIQMQAKTNER